MFDLLIIYIVGSALSVFGITLLATKEGEFEKGEEEKQKIYSIILWVGVFWFAMIPLASLLRLGHYVGNIMKGSK